MSAGSRRWGLPVLLLAVGLLVGCSGAGARPSPTRSSAAAVDLTVGLALEFSTAAGGGYRAGAEQGLRQAQQQWGVRTRVLIGGQGESALDRQQRLRQLAKAGCRPVIAVGFGYADPLAVVAKEFPQTPFALVDDASVQAPNVADLVFAEHEGAFLMGVIAAQATRTQTIGYVGGVRSAPVLGGHRAAFTAGAQAVDPAVEVLSRYLSQAPDYSGFGVPEKGERAAEQLAEGHADVIFQEAKASGQGVIAGARASGAMAIGSDVDQYRAVPSADRATVLTSLVKHLDVPVLAMVRSVVQDEPLRGLHTFGLRERAIGYATSNPAVRPYVARADQLSERIVAGEVSVPRS